MSKKKIVQFEARGDLTCSDFTGNVTLSFKDGSFVYFDSAFIEEQDTDMIVYTEHCGYHCFPKSMLRQWTSVKTEMEHFVDDEEPWGEEAENKFEELLKCKIVEDDPRTETKKKIDDEIFEAFEKSEIELTKEALDKLAEEAKSRVFKPYVWYNKYGKHIEYYSKDESFISKWIDQFLTIHKSVFTNEIIGITLSTPENMLRVENVNE